MTSEIFNGRRFLSWFKYDLKQMWRNQMKVALGIGLSGLIFYALVISYNLLVNHVWQGPAGEGRVLIFIFAFIALELRQTATYGFLTEKSKGSAWLMTPASTFEKWVGMILMTLVVIPVLFFVVFFGVDWLLCLIDGSCGEAIITTASTTFSKYAAAFAAGDAWISTGSLVWIAIVSFFANFLYFLLCGICFKKHKVLFGLAIMFALSMGSSIIMSPIMGANPDAMEDLFNGGFETAQATINWFAAITSVLAVALAGGIYWRLKTIKH